MSLIGNKLQQDIKDGLLQPSGYGNMEVRLGQIKDVERQLCHGFHFGVTGASEHLLAPNASTAGVVDYTIKFASATTVRLISTSSNDTTGGTGAQLIQVIGLDANYNPKIEFLAPGASSAFGTASTGTFIAINEMIVVVVGSLGFNDGDIYCSDATDTSTAGIPDTIIYSGIKENRGFAQCAIHTVRAGYTAFMTHYNSTSGGATNANPAKFIPTIQLAGGSNLIVAELYADRGAGDYPLPGVLPIGEKSIIYIKTSRLTSSTGIVCGAFWHWNMAKTSSYPDIN